MCEAPLTLLEITDAINSLKINKSPGVDGLNSEFYQKIIDPLAPFSLKVYMESMNKE